MSDEFLTWLGSRLIDHLWQSTLFAACIAILARALKDHPARVRYWLWLAASTKFLAPFALLSMLGRQLGTGLVPAAASPQLSFMLDEITRPLTLLRHDLPSGSPQLWPWWGLAARLALALWGAGCVAVCVQSWRRWRQVHAIVRAASVWGGPRKNGVQTSGIEVVSSQSDLEPGVFGIIRPMLYLPARIAESLSEAELDAILTHELCHARRRDNLAAALHTAVEAVFWFHPLVWWLGARLIEERERACDEAVLQTGVKPAVYAESILQVCSQCLRSPSTWAAGATGASLKNRIEEIMANRTLRRLSAANRLLLVGAGLLAAVGPVIVGIASGPHLRAQPPDMTLVAAPSGPKFDVASIKATSKSAGNYGIRIDPGRVDIGAWSIRQLILRAYGLASYRLAAPPWAADLRFDVAAKFPDGAGRDELPEMLQWLLADRFGLAAHAETRELPGFALVVGKGGLKLKPADDPDTGAPPSPNRLEQAGQLIDRLASNDPKALGITLKMAPEVMRIEFKKMPMEALAQILADRLQAPVVNRTGLGGEYQGTLDLPGPGGSAGSAPRVDLPPALEPVGVSLFASVERLGLKLEPRKTSLSVLVVDNVRRAPTEN